MAAICEYARTIYRYKQHIEDQIKLPRPIVAQDMNEETERALLESMKLQKMIMISYCQGGQILHETIVTKAIACQFFKTCLSLHCG
ncbi:hypothetical protein [Bacillus multifaciens]|uniref:hypothetical protein n=1 Tax=Bacillus multifaciens TaxID=3068506 RepID=UPI0027420A51|nr:hypothetical protein [Bacillus sp. WLY-B-L8]MDP7980347.1 hypothetical protein [Bacillus sp. WLY-B-L8]